MTATREDLVRIARDALVAHPHDHDADPVRYEPPDWLLDALKRAYERGDRDGYQRCAAQPALYPEAG